MLTLTLVSQGLFVTLSENLSQARLRPVCLETETLRYLTLFRPIEFSIKLQIIKPGWSITYIEGSQVIISKNIVFLTLKIDFIVTTVQTLVKCGISSGPSLFAKVPAKGFPIYKGLK